MKKLRSIAATGATCIALLVFATTLAHAGFYSPDKEELSVPASIEQPIQAGGETPSRIHIPAIRVKAKVQHVGLGKSGNMAVPSNYNDVGWYRSGPAPGERGSAVIDGHVDNGFGLEAVFHDLDTLEAGDDIYIDLHDGKREHFIVEKVETYAANEVPRDLVFNRSDKARLNLITCAGKWDAKEKEYDARTVVYAVLSE